RVAEGIANVRRVIGPRQVAARRIEKVHGRRGVSEREGAAVPCRRRRALDAAPAAQETAGKSEGTWPVESFLSRRRRPGLEQFRICATVRDARPIAGG